MLKEVIGNHKLVLWFYLEVSFKADLLMAFSELVYEIGAG
jgi:hypothetical protein